MTQSPEIEWLHECTDQWPRKRAKFLFEAEDRPVREEDGVVTAFRDGQVTLRANRRTEGFTFAILEHGYQGVRRGDLVLHSMDAFAGAIGVSESDGKCTPEYVVVNGRPSVVENRFYAYLLRQMALRDFIRVICPSVRERAPRFRYPRFQDVLLPVPPVTTQRAIADFLDRKTAAIDALIEKKERLLELLAEKRAALIHTQMSARFEEVKLGYLVDLLSGYAFPSNGYSDDGEDVRLLRGINISPGLLRWDEVVRWPTEEVAAVSRWLLAPGDIVLGLDRPWISAGLRVARVRDSDCPSLLLQRVARIRCGQRLLPEYLLLAFEWERFQTHVEPDTTGVSVPHISPGQVLSYRVPLPSVEVQRAIVDEVRQQLERDSRLSGAAKRSLRVLREYRQALITAAVTGQLDTEAAEHQPIPEANKQLGMFGEAR